MGAREGILGFTCSAFDLLHAGHVLMLEEASEVCDYLIVGLHVDPSSERPTSKSAPVQSILERYLQLQACKYVDEIIPYQSETDLRVLLENLPISIRILGEEYKDKFFTGKDICERRGIQIQFNQRRHPYSSSSLRERVVGPNSSKRNRTEGWNIE